MDNGRIHIVAERVAKMFLAGRLQLGPRKKTKGRNTIAWYQDFKYDPDGWELKDLMQKVIRYLKKPPVDKLRGYSTPNWFIQLKTKSGVFPVYKWDSRTVKTYQKMVENGQLTGKATGGWSFKKEGR